MADNSGQDVAKTIGRGVLVIATAKLYFMFMGIALTLVIPLFLSVNDLGVYSFVMSVLNPLTMMVIAGTLNGVSKFVSEDEAYSVGVRNKAMSIQLITAIVLVMAFNAYALIFTEGIRTRAFNVASIVVFCYTLYAVYVGYINGLKVFKLQSKLDMTFATMKVLLMLSLAWLCSKLWPDYTVLGAMTGFALASVMILILARFLAPKRPYQPTAVPSGRIFSFVLSLMAYTFIYNALMNVDIWAIEALVPEGLTEALSLQGLPQAISERLQQGLKPLERPADVLNGFYYPAFTVARIPYQAILAVAFVMFPMISKSTFDQEIETTKTYIRETLRYSLIFLMGLSAAFAASSTEIIGGIPAFGRLMEGARDPMTVLSFGYLAFALLIIANAIITASGKPIHAIIITAGGLAVALGACLALIPRLLLTGAALGASLGMVLAVAGSCVYLWRRFGASLPLATLVRTTLAGGATLAAGFVLPFPPYPGKFSVVYLALATAKVLLLLVIYAVIIVTLRELGGKDWERVRRVFRRGK